VHWSPQSIVAVIIVATLCIGTTATVLVAVTRGEPLSTQAVGIVSVVWGALAGGVSAWLGSQGRDPPDEHETRDPREPEAPDDEAASP